MTSDYEQDIDLIRSLLIVTSLQERRDLRVRQLIENDAQELDWQPLSEHMIDAGIWEYTVNQKGSDPKLIFCHPKVLSANPATNLYYRGLCGMSLKMAKKYCGSWVDGCERGKRTKLPEEKARRAARTYNTFICSIMKNSTDWTLENGYRTIVATLGITLDGVMRNKVGQIAEHRIRSLILDWLRERKLIVEDRVDAEDLEAIPGAYALKGGITMQFGSEPDILFSKGSRLLAVVEIKGGTDPAGALERYGAATKSFQHAIAQSPRCRNIYLGGVFTQELHRRIDNDRLVERTFDIIRILESRDARDEFFGELFHHTLRLT